MAISKIPYPGWQSFIEEYHTRTSSQTIEIPISSRASMILLIEQNGGQGSIYSVCVNTSMNVSEIKKIAGIDVNISMNMTTKILSVPLNNWSSVTVLRTV